MGFSQKYGTFVASTGGGTQSVEPGAPTDGSWEVAIFFATLATSAGSIASGNCWVGMVGSGNSTAQGGQWSATDDNLATTDTHQFTSATKGIHLRSDDGATVLADGTVAFDSLGFNVTWNTTPAAAYVIHYALLGGTEVTDAEFIKVTLNTTTGSQEVNLSGAFEPKALFAMASDVVNASVDTLQNDSGWFLGFTDGTTEFNTTLHSDDNRPEARAITQQHTSTNDSTGTLAASGDGANIVSALSFTSFDADGFTVNVDATPGGAARAGIFLAIGGTFQVDVIHDTSKTSTGTKATTTAFQPEIAVICGRGLATASGKDITSDGRFSIGAGNSSTNRGCIWIGEADADDPTNSDSNHDNANFLKHFTPAGGGSPTAEEVGDIDSFNSTDITIDWSTADATAREWGAIVFAAAAVGGGDPEGSLVGGKLLRGGLLTHGVLVR